MAESEDFKTVATSRGLDEETIAIIEKCEDEEGLSKMTPEQLNELELPDKQRKALQKWLVDLYVRFNREDSMLKTDTPNLSLNIEKGADKVDTAELDYDEVPGTPRPEAYDRCINIGVTGQVSSGKSSLINALRGLEPSDPDAASTKIGDKNNELKPYKLHKVDKMLLWDLPAVEEISEEYLSKVQLDQYDAVVVCSAERLSEWDLWIATMAQERDIRTFVARTKIDRDVESDKDDYGDEHDEEKLLGRIKADIEGQMDKVDLYMVSTKKPDWEKWDMPKLLENVTGVVRRENKIKPEKAPADVKSKDNDSDKISRISDEAEVEDNSAKGKILALVKKHKGEIAQFVAKAAKQASIKLLNKQVGKYKKDFGVENEELPGVNLDPLEQAIDKLDIVKKSGLKTTFMSCFGSKSKAALDKKSQDTIATHIKDEAPTLMETAIDKCKTVALAKLNL